MTFIYKNLFILQFIQIGKDVNMKLKGNREIETDDSYFTENIILIIALALIINISSTTWTSLCCWLFSVTIENLYRRNWARKENRQIKSEKEKVK